MGHMSPLPARLLSLPEEWTLLSLTDSGKVRDSNQAVVGCVAAELGELALRRKLLVRSRKFKIFGFDGYRTSPAEIQVIDTSRAGLPWADELLADLERRRVSEQRLSLGQWLRQRREAFSLHLDALAERGVLRRAPGTRSVPFRFLSSERYYPDPAVRDTLIAELRAAGSGQNQLDEHMVFLSDLVSSSLLNKDLGIELRVSQRLDRGRGVGTVGSVPEDLRHTSAVLASSVPKNRRYQG